MKDSFGGTIMMYVAIFFLAIYVVLIALTLRYSQAFKTKNRIIDIIEQYDGIVSDSVEDPVNTKIVEYLQKVNVKPNKVEISKIDNDDARKTCYYKVSSKIEWEWPFFGYKGEWIIAGESKSVKNCSTITIDDSLF